MFGEIVLGVGERSEIQVKKIFVCTIAAVFIIGLAQRAASLQQTTAQAASAAKASAKAASAQVTIDNFTFAPATMTVEVGSTVTWTNRDDIPHTVVSADDPRAFKSKALDTGDTFSFTFSKAGTYSYFCSIHPKMVGRIVVR